MQNMDSITPRISFSSLRLKKNANPKKQIIGNFNILPLTYIQTNILNNPKKDFIIK